MYKKMSLMVSCSVLLLGGFGCTNTPPVSPTISSNVVEQTHSQLIEPTIEIKDQQIQRNQIQIERTNAQANSWVVIHLVIDEKPGEIIGLNLVSAGENKLFGIGISSEKTLTPELIAMLHVDRGHTGTFESTSDVPVMDKNGNPVMIKFKVLNPPGLNGGGK